MKIRTSRAWSVFGAVALCGAAFGQAASPPAAQAPTKQEPARTQGGGTVTTGQAVVRSTGIPQKDTLIKMMAVASVEFKETRMEEVMRWVVATSGADADILWMDDTTGSGLDKETLVTAKFENRSILDIVEGVMERYGDPTGGAGGATWQMTKSGAIQISTKERLNKFRRVEVYPIRDLLLETPNYTNSYELDLQQALQQSGQGGGSSQSPFKEGNQGGEEQRKDQQEKANEVIDIITQLVEPDQWQNNGGEAASIRYFQGALLVNAPDYVHRGLDGYPYWPKAGLRVSHQGSRRYVSLGMDAGTNQLKGFENQPVTATTGGGDLIPGGGG